MEERILQINKELSEYLKELHGRKDEMKRELEKIEKNIERISILLEGFRNAGFSDEKKEKAHFDPSL